MASKSKRRGRPMPVGGAALAGIFVLCLACSTQELAFPGESWEREKPAALGLDDEKLDELARALGGRGCVIVDGYLVKRWGSQSEKEDWYSAAKPVFSTLLLFALHEGRLESVDAPLAEFGWPLRPQDRGMTLRQLANMTSGYARPDSPGAAWAYNDYAIQLYQKTLFDRIYQEDPETVAGDPSRLGALEFEDGLSFRGRNRRLHASVRDYARIAWLWLSRGRWKGEELLPERLFDQYMRPQVPADLPHTAPGNTDDYLRVRSFGGGSDHFTRFGAGIYGFNWWFNAAGRLHPEQRTWPDAPPDAFMAIGARGSGALVLPSQRAVVVAIRSKWGELEAGQPRSRMNAMVRLAFEAVSPESTAGSVSDAADENVDLSGELRTWHRITLTFRGPRSSEKARRNPFRRYRLDVTFRKGERQLTVPGYYAADGDAAETGASAGDRWRVHFAPDEAGVWEWRASFREGDDVAVSEDPDAGRSSAFDGTTGRFRVAPSDKTGRDHRARGALRYVGERYLRFAGTDEYFLKGGTNSPENFLAYDEFDQTPPSHRYAPHARDFRPGDPTWRGGRGKNVIGALNYLAEKGVNAVYFLTMNVRGDGRDVWPWIDPDDRDRFDCSKLDQWEIVFSHMDRLGILLHVVTQEQENDQLLDRGALGVERRLYYRELVARFGHHLALTWNLGEENTNSDAERRAFAEAIARLDPYDHPIVVHTHPGRIARVYEPLLGFAHLGGASLQTNQSHAEVARWIARSAAAGHPWVVTLDEIGPSTVGVVPDADDPDHDEVRKRHLWGSLMAGGAGVEWYFGYRFAHDDLDLEDWRSRDRMWDQTRHALDFFRTHLPFHEMESCDPLVEGAPGHCFAKRGSIYALYLPEGGEARLDLEDAPGPFEVQWYDPRRGGALERGSVAGVAGPGIRSVGRPPRDETRDWAVLVRAP